MSATEVRDVLESLSLTQVGAATQLRIGLRTVNRWCAEGVADPVAVALLRLLAWQPKLVTRL
jgi:DNA-binding transcriptional regulator YiaG